MVVIGTALGGGVLLYKMGNLMRAKPRTSKYQLQKGGHNSDTVESRPTHVRTAHIAVCATLGVRHCAGCLCLAESYLLHPDLLASSFELYRAGGQVSPALAKQTTTQRVVAVVDANGMVLCV
jgi:hypothetical protein